MAETGQRVSPFEALLDESLELVAGRLQAAIAGMMAKADESLVAMTSATQNRETQQLYQQTRKVLAAQPGTLEGEFQKAFLQEFSKHASKAKAEDPVFAEIEITLSIVGDEDLEENLSFRERAAKLRRFCDEELAALDQRVGVLLGDANLAAEANPFGPETIGEAFKKACRALADADAKVRGVLLQLFDDHVIDQVRSIYKDVNTLLVKNSILPKIRYGVAKKAEGPKGAHDKDRDEDADAEEKGEAQKPTEENIFAMLQSLVAQGGGGGGGGGGVQLPPGAVIVQGAELIGSLHKLQQELQGLQLGAGGALPEGVSAAAAAGEANVLRELKSTTFGASLQQMDAATLDIVSMLFDQLFDDPKIPAALKGLIGRLQIPMLKVAIADKELFSKKTHPARQLLDTFGDVAVRIGEDFSADSPTFVHLEAIVQHLVTNFQEDVGVFDRAREQLREIIAGHDKQVEAQAQAEVQRIEQAENLSAAKTAAEEEVKQRVQAHRLPGPVLEFLIQQWLRYLLVHHAKSGSGSAEWKDAVETMDQLVQSLEPVTTPEERKKLAATVPGLVRKLVVGMNAVGTEPQAREQFLGALMKCHTVALAKPKEGAPPAPPPPAPAAAPPEALDFTAPVKVQNPYGGGSVEVVGLDFAPKPADKAQRASAKAALMSSLAVEPPAGMEMGAWVEFHSKDESEPRRTAKLLFVSPRKTRYLFSDRRGKDVLELSRAEIVRRLRTGEAVRLKEEPSEPLFDRFMNGVMGKLRTPAAKTAVAA